MKDRKPEKLFSYSFSMVILIILLKMVLPETVAASELVILYSNDIRGDTEPCG